MNRKKDGTYAEDILKDLVDDSDESSLKTSDLQLTDDDDDGQTVQINHEEASKAVDDDPTQQVDFSNDPSYQNPTETYQPSVSQQNDPSISDKVRTSVGRLFTGTKTSHGGSSNPNPTEIKLAQAESVRVAQERIFELENLVQNLRSENEQLIAAGETLQRRTDELMSKQEKSASQSREQKQFFEDERRILQEALNAKEREMESLKQKVGEGEARLAANMQKIRIREKELENRLELIKIESSALIHNKNEMILDLKKNIDQLNIELENYRSQGQKLHQKIDQKHEVLRRTVRTLRIALTMLEGDDDDKDQAS